METPLIDTLRISEEEKKITIAKVQNLWSIYTRNLFHLNGNTNRLFEEWKAIAVRVKSGRPMLDKAESGNVLYLNSLQDLYKLQLKLLGLYELCFRKFLKEAQFQRAYNIIYGIVST